MPKYSMKKPIILIIHLILFLNLSCKNESPKKNEVKFTLSLHKVHDGWGYTIYKNDKKFIIQEHIPAIGTIKTFQSKEEAEKIGSLVKIKLEHNVIPPSISIKELDSLKITIN